MTTKDNVVDLPGAIPVGIQPSNLSPAEQMYAAAMEVLAEVEVEEEELFLAYKYQNPDHPTSDQVARAQAIIEMNGKQTRTEAMVNIYNARMFNDADSG